MTTSLLSRPKAQGASLVVACRLLWVCITPLGSPVVPDVNWIVATSSAAGAERPARRGAAAVAERPRKCSLERAACPARAVDGEDVLEGVDAVAAPCSPKRREVEAAKPASARCRRAPDQPDDVLDLTTTQDRDQRARDGADPVAGQVHGGEVPPVGQLEADRLAGLDAELEQPGRDAVDRLGQLAEGEPVGPAAVGGIGDRGDVVCRGLMACSRRSSTTRGRATIPAPR